MKKFTSILLSTGLILSLSVPAMADEAANTPAVTPTAAESSSENSGNGEPAGNADSETPEVTPEITDQPENTQGTEGTGGTEETGGTGGTEETGGTGETPQPKNTPDPSASDEAGGAEQGSGEAEQTEPGETDTQDEGGKNKESDPEKDSENEADEDSEKDSKKDSGKDSKKDSGKEESGDQTTKKDKESASEKEASKEQDASDKTKDSENAALPAEETIPAPVLTDPIRHVTTPTRITNYAVKHYEKIKKAYIKCTAEEAAVREYAGSSSDETVVAKLAKGAIVRLIDETDPSWWFVETRDQNGKVVRGYAESGCFRKLTKAESKKVTVKGVKNLNKKTVKTLWEDPSKVTVLKTTNTGFGAVEKTTYPEMAFSAPGTVREDVINEALQYLGNPYAEGGTSLTEGTDGANLVKSVYAEYGISLPDSLEEQYNAGTKIALVNAQPGDLIFYKNGSNIEQAMICLSNDGKGNIQAIQASPKKERVLVSALDRNYIWRVRTFDQLNAASTMAEEQIIDLTEWTPVGGCRLTSYCFACNTPSNSAITASGIPATEWHTVAVDSSVIPLGSKVYIEGYGLFVAEDTGVKGNWCDLYVYEQECAIWDIAQVYYQ